ncbi:MAG: GyrI-like domain-containing protein [Candidatus Promineifilaceae bacterium]
MSKIDFKKEYKHLYRPSPKAFEILDVPPMNFLMVDGQGDPNTSSAYQEAMEGLYAAAYTLKFASKRELEKDYIVPPLEGLWWAEDVDVFTIGLDKDAWQWTAMIMTPDWIDQEVVALALDQAQERKELPALKRMRLETYHEGLSVQIMHIGPFSAEGPTLERMHRVYIPENGLVENGKHHEIYLSDPRRVPPERWQTVLRQPVRKASG